MDLINKVAESGLILIDLESLLPKNDIIAIDIKQFLFKELLLKEKEFRLQLANYSWEQYHDKIIALYCSVDTIIPRWAYMLILKYLLPYTTKVHFGTINEVNGIMLLEEINKIDASIYQNQKVVIKGCSKYEISERAYIEISKLLLPQVQSLFFGEPCSTVPIFKRK